jgi:hypothetical protein
MFLLAQLEQMLPAVIAAVWLAVVTLTLAACRCAARADEVRAGDGARIRP